MRSQFIVSDCDSLCMSGEQMRKRCIPSVKSNVSQGSDRPASLLLLQRVCSLRVALAS